MTRSDASIHQLAIHAIRTLSIDAVEKAKSGHPGLPMGAAPMAYVLWTRFLKHNPSNPNWFNRDRFVLSAGHGSMLLYSLLHLTGYDLSLEDVKQFREWGSKTPGHPEHGHTPGVDATTGPLGQGIAMAVGMAMAERRLAWMYNRDDDVIVDHYTYALCGDGDLMEGIASEAASLAGHLQLGRLVLLYDSNDISLDGETRWTFTESVGKRFEAYGWQYIRVEDGNDIDAIEKAIASARAETGKPSLIEIKTTIGFGSPNKGGTSKAHGAPLGADEVKLVKEAYGWPHEPLFHVPDEVRDHFASLHAKWSVAEAHWLDQFTRYKEKQPALAEKFEGALANRLPDGWDAHLPSYEIGAGLATREAGRSALNAIAEQVDWVFGGSADLSGSDYTNLKKHEPFQADNLGGRNIWFGVREHAMGAALNGMSLHGGLRVYGGTFFVFSDYLRPAIRLAALMRLRVIYVFTHDSIAVGQDGPTHEPIEQLAALRAMPGMTVLRPADAIETNEAWRYTMEQANGPVALVLTRQPLPVLAGTANGARDGVQRGGYVVSDTVGSEEARAIIIATGSEVSLAILAQSQLANEGIPTRVVSLPSWELFEQQPAAYRDYVIPSSVTARVAIEMASPFGWERYVGNNGRIIGLSHFGASGKPEVLQEEYGFTVDNIATIVRELVQ